jgi:hypothetical protein
MLNPLNEAVISEPDAGLIVAISCSRLKDNEVCGLSINE